MARTPRRPQRSTAHHSCAGEAILHTSQQSRSQRSLPWRAPCAGGARAAARTSRPGSTRSAPSRSSRRRRASARASPACQQPISVAEITKVCKHGCLFSGRPGARAGLRECPPAPAIRAPRAPGDDDHGRRRPALPVADGRRQVQGGLRHALLRLRRADARRARRGGPRLPQRLRRHGALRHEGLPQRIDLLINNVHLHFDRVIFGQHFRADR